MSSLPHARSIDHHEWDRVSASRSRAVEHNSSSICWLNNWWNSSKPFCSTAKKNDGTTMCGWPWPTGSTFYPLVTLIKRKSAICCPSDGKWEVIDEMPCGGKKKSVVRFSLTIKAKRKESGLTKVWLENNSGGLMTHFPFTSVYVHLDDVGEGGGGGEKNDRRLRVFWQKSMEVRWKRISRCQRAFLSTCSIILSIRVDLMMRRSEENKCLLKWKRRRGGRGGEMRKWILWIKIDFFGDGFSTDVTRFQWMSTIRTGGVSAEKSDVSRSFHANRTRLSIFQFLHFTFQFPNDFVNDFSVGIRRRRCRRRRRGRGRRETMHRAGRRGIARRGRSDQHLAICNERGSSRSSERRSTLPCVYLASMFSWQRMQRFILTQQSWQEILCLHGSKRISAGHSSQIIHGDRADVFGITCLMIVERFNKVKYSFNLWSVT